MESNTLHSSNNEFPLVSICIPTYNGEEFLAETLQSALTQNYSNLEILISDDSSTDQTVAIAEKFREKSKYKFVILKHKRFGQVGNWNFCIQQARGKYIKFLFQDDILEPTCIGEMVALAEQDPEIGLVFSKRNVLLEKGAELDLHCKAVFDGCQNLHEAWSQLQTIQSGKNLLDDPKLLEGSINKVGEPSVVLVRKDTFEKLGTFDTDFSQLVDVEMWLRIFSYYKVGFVDKSLASFRVHTGQQTNKNLDQGVMNLEFCKFYAKLKYSSLYDSTTQFFKDRVTQRFEQCISPLLANHNMALNSTDSLEQQVKKLEQRIVAMESSKFWAIRRFWFKFKSNLGFNGNE